MSNIQPVFHAGQTVYIDLDTMQVIGHLPITTIQPDNPQPLVEAPPVQPQPTDSNQSSAKAKKGQK